jgi:hypothetical protein
MPFPTDTWREKLPLIESDTYRDTIEGFWLLSRASVGFIKLLFLRLVFASAYIFSSPARMIIGLYDLFRWARRWPLLVESYSPCTITNLDKKRLTKSTYNV